MLDVHDRMALPGGSGGVPQFWLGVVIETIDGQGATEAPQESEARLQALLSSLDDLVFELDENGIACMRLAELDEQRAKKICDVCPTGALSIAALEA